MSSALLASVVAPASASSSRLFLRRTLQARQPEVFFRTRTAWSSSYDTRARALAFVPETRQSHPRYSTQATSSEEPKPKPEAEAQVATSTESKNSSTGGDVTPARVVFSGGGGRGRRNRPWREFVRFAAWLPVAAFVFSHAISVGQVKGGSMIPTFNPSAVTPGTKHKCDVVLLNRWSVGQHFYRVGDIVTLISPENPDSLLVKRILALEGDIVILHSGSSRGPGNRVKIRIPPGHAWVEGDASVEEDAHLGDNMGKGRSVGSSDDSRTFGPVALGLITSRIDWILWPPSRFGRPGPRPGFTATKGDFVSFDGSRNALRNRRDPTAFLGSANPDDSPLTPFLDDSTFEMEKTGKLFYSGAVGNAIPDVNVLKSLDEAKAREDREDIGQDDPQEEALLRRRAWLNSLSRGGSLGRDAIDEESVPHSAASRLI